jgi:hypothetical protein
MSKVTWRRRGNSCSQRTGPNKAKSQRRNGFPGRSAQPSTFRRSESKASMDGRFWSPFTRPSAQDILHVHHYIVPRSNRPKTCQVMMTPYHRYFLRSTARRYIAFQTAKPESDNEPILVWIFHHVRHKRKNYRSSVQSVIPRKLHHRCHAA